MDKIGLWKISFQSDKIKHTMEKAAREINTIKDDLETMQKLVNAQGAIRKANHVIETEDPSDGDVDFIVTYHFYASHTSTFNRQGQQ